VVCMKKKIRSMVSTLILVLGVPKVFSEPP
jgi:hypothetical protein